MHPFHHAASSARQHGGEPEDYLPIHHWFDESKQGMPDSRHRAMRHHAEGIFWCEQIFGVTVKNSDGKEIPTRVIGEQHVKEDLGRIPTLADWLREMRLCKWMSNSPKAFRESLEEVNAYLEFRKDKLKEAEIDILPALKDGDSCG